MKYIKKLGFLLLFFSLFFGTVLKAENLVEHRTDFSFINENGNKVTWENTFKNKWNIFIFFDTYCPFSVNSAPALHRFFDYVNYYYSGYINIVFVEALKRRWNTINYFKDKLGFQNYSFYMVPNRSTDDYLNVDRTPTLIIMDPYGNIVDKVAGKSLAVVYAKHLDLILGRYFSIKGIYDYGDPLKIINETNTELINKLKVAIQSFNN